MKKKTKRQILIGIVVILFLLWVLMSLFTISANASGLVDNKIDAGNLYSTYSLDHYQLDFFVDSSWDWLPWNWSDGVGKSVMYGLYAITNFLWTVSLYISNATGYVIQEAYRLDFISDTADAIGKNIQILAGISSHGFAKEGFYIGFLLIFILIVGIYVTYVGLIKKETSKGIRAVINFVTVFLLSASFIAYAPSYIKKINDFSTDISSAALSLGTKIVVPDATAKGKDSVDLIRDSLFAIQVQQPWLLLQFNDSNKEKIGVKRVDKLLAVDPNSENGKKREEVVKEEITKHNNKNLTLTKTMNRLGTVVFLFLFDLGISVFIFLLTGIMIFSQILFVIFAMFLPISFLLSMLPTYQGMAKKAIEKLFNTIMMRAGITLVITTAFSISSMFYALSGNYPFFMVAFLQIVTFGGIYLKLSDLMGMFSLQSGDSQHFGGRIIQRPKRLAQRNIRSLKRNIGRTLVGTSLLSKRPSKQKGSKTSSPNRKNSSKNLILTADNRQQNKYIKDKKTHNKNKKTTDKNKYSIKKNPELNTANQKNKRRILTKEGTKKDHKNHPKQPIITYKNKALKDKKRTYQFLKSQRKMTQVDRTGKKVHQRKTQKTPPKYMRPNTVKLKNSFTKSVKKKG
ncbi:CD3337/EF1877 family mobilome membrane protein [Enterococcus faecalis]|uniref:CD3337/EF1877 family mobilome membrane protein n=1 Tax=Enterococcus faecalis TaxID=1351 RepID=UPI002890FEA7|nr:FUSC family protein [Enterococcus faecalis]MDT2164501.1 FUSC family protein [Enterococcus faecalis]